MVVKTSHLFANAEGAGVSILAATPQCASSCLLKKLNTELQQRPGYLIVVPGLSHFYPSAKCEARSSTLPSPSPAPFPQSPPTPSDSPSRIASSPLALGQFFPHHNHTKPQPYQLLHVAPLDLAHLQSC